MPSAAAEATAAVIAGQSGAASGRHAVARGPLAVAAAVQGVADSGRPVPAALVALPLASPAGGGVAAGAAAAGWADVAAGGLTAADQAEAAVGQPEWLDSPAAGHVVAADVHEAAAASGVAAAGHPVLQCLLGRRDACAPADAAAAGGVIAACVHWRDAGTGGGGVTKAGAGASAASAHSWPGGPWRGIDVSWGTAPGVACAQMRN